MYWILGYQGHFKLLRHSTSVVKLVRCTYTPRAPTKCQSWC